jgi:hypothetical protein
MAFCDGHATSFRPGPDASGDTVVGQNKYFIGTAP